MGPYAGYGYGLPYVHHAAVVATGAAVPVAVGGYKAVAGNNGDLEGPVHEVPALFGAPALNSQVNEDSQGSLTVGTSAYITHVGKREADPYLYGYPYALGYPFAHAAVATNLPVPVAVGGYKSVAGDNGELKGAVHEVPALFGAPALNTQENEGTSLTVGTSVVPVGHYIGKREAEADPYLLYGGLGYGYGGYGLGYGHGLAGYGYGYGLGYGYPYYG